MLTDIPFFFVEGKYSFETSLRFPGSFRYLDEALALELCLSRILVISQFDESAHSDFEILLTSFLGFL